MGIPTRNQPGLTFAESSIRAALRKTGKKAEEDEETKTSKDTREKSSTLGYFGASFPTAEWLYGDKPSGNFNSLRTGLNHHAINGY